MRDPDRIPVIIKAILEKWVENPDQRLGQLLYNLGIVGRGDPFFIDDQTVLDALDIKDIKEYRESRRGPEDAFTDSFGLRIVTHRAGQCAGQRCIIHNPSQHHMSTWKTNIRGDKRFLIERICQHGVGHPDPDSLAYFIRVGDRYMGVHGCCGCCIEPQEVGSEDRPSGSVPRRTRGAHI